MSRFVIGIGARRTAKASEVVAVIQEAIAVANLEVADVASLAGYDKPETHKALVDAASQLHLPVAFHAREALQTFADKCKTHSDRVFATLGVPSIAETAALASAGTDAELILPRIKHATVTAAIAKATNK